MSDGSAWVSISKRFAVGFALLSSLYIMLWLKWTVWGVQTGQIAVDSVAYQDPVRAILSDAVALFAGRPVVVLGTLVTALAVGSVAYTLHEWSRPDFPDPDARGERDD